MNDLILKYEGPYIEEFLRDIQKWCLSQVHKPYIKVDTNTSFDPECRIEVYQNTTRNPNE